MAKDFERAEHLERAFNEMHKIKPQVSIKRIDNNKYEVQLKHKGREVVLSERMKDGLTQEALLEFGGEVRSFKRYYDAELAATAILKG